MIENLSVTELMLLPLLVLSIIIAIIWIIVDIIKLESEFKVGYDSRRTRNRVHNIDNVNKLW